MDKRAAAIDLNNLKQKNAGKVQFNAIREEVLALLDKGYSRRALHAVLRENGLFTGSYRRFCEYVQGIEKQVRSSKEPATSMAGTTAPAVPEKPAPHPAQPEKPAAGGFTHATAPNINDLI